MIEVRDLKKSFEDRLVLDGLSFSIQRGEVYGLLGPNGVGKSTAMNILCGLLESDGGFVEIGGHVPSASTKSLIGVAPQEISAYRDLTCLENLLFFGRIYGLGWAESKKRAREVVATFGLEEYADFEVARLSGGWQRRVNIAIALVHSPSVLILDEPTAGLDIEARFEIWNVIAHLRSNHVTVLLTTHLLEEAEALCTRIGILKKGRIVLEGSLDELKASVPAQQIAVVVPEDEESFRLKASSLGLACRVIGGKQVLFLPQRSTLGGLIETFSGITLTSVALQEVGLEHAYIEATRDGST